MGRWVPLACFVVLLALLGCAATRHRKARPRDTAHPSARSPLRWAWAAVRRLRVSVPRFAVRHWRPLTAIALVVLASESLAAGVGSGSADLASALAPDPWHLKVVESGSAAAWASETTPSSWDSPAEPTPTPTPVPAQPPSPPPPPPPTPAPPPPPSAVPTPAPAPRVVAAAAPSGGDITGIATWYGGPDGYGPEDIMADGSYFNPDDPTITAANAWPLGTRLRVCHLDRCIEVQVRDRGAFTHALDLSRAAFSQLAPLSAGVITVTISVVG